MDASSDEEVESFDSNRSGSCTSKSRRSMTVGSSAASSEFGVDIFHDEPVLDLSVFHRQ